MSQILMRTSDEGPGPSIQWPIVLTAISALGCVCVAALWVAGPRQAGAALIGGLAGLGLYHASFGFTGAWRQVVVERRGAGLRAQFLLILVTCIVSFPLIAWGAELGWPTGGFVFPFGYAAALGAFLFGIGMQLGGGCASGTLFTTGGGSTRMAVTLIAFVLGSVFATAHMHLWNALPKLPAFSLIEALGPTGAYGVTATVLAGLALLSIAAERRRHGELAPGRSTLSLVTGPWSATLGALVLALVCCLTFLVVGRPWGITSGFALWGAKIFQLFGIPVESWPYWAAQKPVLEASVFRDLTSVMNFGVLLGALAAAGLAGRFAPVFKMSRMELASALIGGLLMGYGARLAYGCNIGAYLGGITSGSMHGWAWLAFGFAGSLLGSRVKRHLVPA